VAVQHLLRVSGVARLARPALSDRNGVCAKLYRFLPACWLYLRSGLTNRGDFRRETWPAIWYGFVLCAEVTRCIADHKRERSMPRPMLKKRWRRLAVKTQSPTLAAGWRCWFAHPSSSIHALLALP